MLKNRKERRVKNKMDNKSYMGIYVHIPFCIRKCAYCDFLSGPANKEEQNQYMEHLMKEIQLVAQVYKPTEQVESIFFGGGTPSVVDAKWIVDIISVIKEWYHVKENAEITVECNPGTLTKEKITQYKKGGVNRISLGLQSANNKELALLGRIHTWEQFLESYQLVRDAGISNVNVDLMSALPGQTMESWQDTLMRVTKLNPEHISAYSLIIEPGTPFYETYESHPEWLPSEEEDRELYSWTKNWLKAQGYSRYEISNYAKVGMESRHNNFYWTGVPYLGFGIGAASFYRNMRMANITDRMQYIAILKKSCSAQEKVQLLRDEVHLSTKEEQMEECLFLGLRRMEGVSERVFQKQFQVAIDDIYGDVIKKYVEYGFLNRSNGRIALTDRGIDVSNVILAEFLLS